MTPALIMHNFYCSPAGAIDFDALGFIARAGLSDETQILAVKNLIVAAKSNGWWHLCDLIYPMIGGNAGAHAQNMKSSLFPLDWQGTVNHTANGVAGDGLTGYAKTGYIPAESGQMAQNSFHFSTYMRVAGTVGRYDFGVNDGTNELSWLTGNVATARAQTMSNNATLSLVVNTINGTFKLTAATRRDAANVFGYNMVDGQRQVVINSVAMPANALELYALALNTNGVASLFQDKNIAFLTAGAAIPNLAMFNLMAADIQQFQTTLGRQV